MSKRSNCILRAHFRLVLQGLILIWTPVLISAQMSKRTVALTRESVDESAAGLTAFKIKTPSATYYLEKTGGGLSSLIDRDGNDWISFHPKKGSGPGGEFRGFPNAVHRQAGNYFHPKNNNTNPVITRVEHVRSDYVSITAQSKTGHWAGRYEFFPKHCTFTMTRVPDGYKYWVLYEGTPGGVLEPDSDFLVRSDGKKRMLTERWSEDLPGAEWLYFADGKLDRSLFLVNHAEDDAVDSYYAMGKSPKGMTVFGFGRSGINKFLTDSPRSFSIGLVESRDISVIARVVKSLRPSRSQEKENRP